MSGLTDTLKGLVAGAVPLLANTLLPGSGGLARTLIGKVFGVDPGDDDAMVAAVANATPEQWLELKKLESDHETELVRISADLDKAYLADRQDARGRDTQLKLAGHHNYRADIMLAFAFIALIVIVCLINTTENIAPAVLAIMNISVGSLLKMIGDAFQFEFGSSRGSKEKDLK